MISIQLVTESPHCRTRCANCEYVHSAESLDPIDDPEQRLTPGDVVPAGQCRFCGALAYIEDTD